MSINQLQFICVLMGVSVSIGNARGWVIARPLGMLGAVLSSFIYYPAGLYAKCLLNGVIFFLNAYGWHQWLYGGMDKTPLLITKTRPLSLIYILATCLIGTTLLGYLLLQYAQANMPYWDSLHTVMYLTAQWMLVHKKLENWIFWILADIFYVGVLYYKALYILSGMQIFYTLLAIYGYYNWYKTYTLQEKSTTNTH